MPAVFYKKSSDLKSGHRSGISLSGLHICHRSAVGLFAESPRHRHSLWAPRMCNDYIIAPASNRGENMNESGTFYFHITPFPDTKATGISCYR